MKSNGIGNSKDMESECASHERAQQRGESGREWIFFYVEIIIKYFI